MSIELLLSFLNTLSQTGPSLDADIRERVVREQFKRGHILASPARRNHAIWYIVSGLAKEYYYDASGNAVITAFWKENELMVDAESFFGKKRSEKYIELIDDSILLTLDSRQAHQLQALHPEAQPLGYSILSAAKRKDSERSELLVLDAMSSNKRFCEMFPWGRISVTDTAQYLGLSRKTITVIRSRLNISQAS